MTILEWADTQRSWKLLGKIGVLLYLVLTVHGKTYLNEKGAREGAALEFFFCPVGHHFV